MKSLPSISIITPTWNSNLPLFERVLRTLAGQSYPKHLIEHIVIDAGSENGTAELAKDMGVKFLYEAILRFRNRFVQVFA